MTTSTWWCAHAWLGGDRAESGIVLDVADGCFTAVRHAAAPPSGARILSGLVLPGLANAHSHAFHRALRGHVQRGRGDFWTWRDDAYAIAARLTPESYYALARATFAEMALAGITTVGEFHYLHHSLEGTAYADPHAFSTALVQAAAEAGIRLTLLDTLYLTGGVGQPPSGVQRRFSDGSVDAWAQRTSALVDGDQVRHGLAVHSVRAVPFGALREAGVVAAERAVPLHAHVSEQPRENADCRDHYGRTPTALLRDAGILSQRFTAVHATHVDAGDIGLLAAAGSGVCFCPTTERDLADGVGPASALTSAGVPLSLGSDSQAVIDLLEEARAVELDERLVTGVRGTFTASTLLTMATAHGLAALGWPMKGLAVGGPADFIEVGLESARLAGVTDASLLESAAFAGAAVDVNTTVVGGEAVVVDGQHVRLDVAHELRESIAVARGERS
jgi:formiminoglutamate deiminase